MTTIRLIVVLFISLLLISFLVFIFKNSDSKKTMVERGSFLPAKSMGENSRVKDYVLEIVGMGVTYEKYRQLSFLEAIQKKSSYSTIREEDPKKYPWSANDKRGVGGGRAIDALENGIAATPMYWGIPSLYAGATRINKYRIPSDIRPVLGLVGAAGSSGMAWHLFVNGPWNLSERPDHIFEIAFSFFDEHPDAPYVVISANDTMERRESDQADDAPSLIRDGYYIPERPDSTVVFVLARRERVEFIRKFSWEDIDNRFGQEKFRMMYYDLKKKVPHHEREKDPKGYHSRAPTITEWLAATSEFVKRPDVRNAWGTPEQRANWKPTPWFPVPWSKEQLATFDRLPTLGFVHRPVFVKMTDNDGKLLPQGQARTDALKAGWQEALATLSDTERKSGPARLITGTDNNTDQALTLHAMLRDYAEQGGSRYDLKNQKQFIDTDRRLGNTGAATWFMQMAIGVMGSYRDGGVSAAVNLRDPAEASIVFISPPPDDKRKTQQHPNGGDVFGHNVEPMYDPDHYSDPGTK